MEIKERFLNYVSFDTQSVENSQTVPSTSKQLKLGKYLVEELQSLGIENAKIDEYGVVYGTIPSNNNHQGDVIGFIAHMDTSPDASGKDIHPQIIKNYQGQKITLNEDKKLYLDPEQYPQLLHLIHHDLITTDGTTLLGADDKAGIAIIMQMVEYLHTHPEFKHNDIQIAFTPDEEIGCGSNHFDVKYFNADYAYTIDGGDIHIVEYENFNAFSAKVNIHGRSIHPGSAKNKMINSTRVAYEFDSLLPVHMRPESTEGYEGFNHLHAIQGTCEETTMDYIIRNHDLQQAKKQCQEFIDIVEFLNKKYGYQIIDLTITESYLNMKEALKDHMFIVEQALAAIKENGLDAYCSPIRGGTDGARLTFMGLPCPNLGTGGFNYHGPYEYCSLTMMEKQVQILLHILKSTASK
ncbi:peptidase T [Coprobacillus sp. TM10-10]|jgi:tripeptide aminopeptidase|uniref:Peptidase T n=1 Tax=Faecalibacillus intestinalis TaxID=1982626 RepID=A0AAP2UGZ1_9FIRM|nr:peptidase T [Faecalibacillus intestinalis]RGI01633.1 peptidase T [Coprobacillus sp. TM10-10]MCB8592524.1 peptidase T [Faecalibacillus intestinalis]MCB8613719.1 peptidase T [Faecalibacillus intestinalis]MCG4681135.1 peptidase T [Faecalibacillus intestinalis]MCG4713841.1 peptidase T [Faecalibacillus intestinalis]